MATDPEEPLAALDDAEVIGTVTDALGDFVKVGHLGTAVLIGVSGSPGILDTPEMRGEFDRYWVQACQLAEAAEGDGQARRSSAPGGYGTAGELRAALAGVPDDTPIVVNTPDPQYDDMAEEWVIRSAGYGQIGWGDGYGLERDQAFGLNCRPAGDFRVKPARPRKENGND